MKKALLTSAALAVAAALAGCGGGSSSSASNQTTDNTVDVNASAQANAAILFGGTGYTIQFDAARPYQRTIAGATDSDGFTALAATDFGPAGELPPVIEYRLTSQGWQRVAEQLSFKRDVAANKVILRDAAAGSLAQLDYTEQDVTGKSVIPFMKDYLDKAPAQESKLQGVVFPAGSRVAQLTTYQGLNDFYEGNDGQYAVALNDGLPLATLAQMRQNISFGNPLCARSQTNTYALVTTSNADGVSGVVQVYAATNNLSTFSKCTATGTPVATGTWTEKTVNTAKLMTFIVPFLDANGYFLIGGTGGGASSTRAHEMFTEINGKVVQGLTFPTDATARVLSTPTSILNQTAINTVKAALGFQ